VSKELGVEIRSYGIGWGEYYVDVYGDWEKKREVEGDGTIRTSQTGSSVGERCKWKVIAQRSFLK
jgi:hypothetical protein